MTKPFPQPIYVTRPLLPPLSEMTKQLEDIWASQCLTNFGPKHIQLEAKLTELLKVANLSLFNNGTIALMVASEALRLTGEVITTPFTFPATSHVLSWNRVQPVFCDIDPDTLTIDPDRLEALITPQTTGILGVHVYGIPCKVQKIQEIADRYGLKVIYDAAHAFGVEIDGRGIGTFGDISMFSFHATKLFHTVEGGALAFGKDNLKSRLHLLKNFGINSEEEVLIAGLNGKMNELQAAMGLIVIDHLEDERSKRAEIMRVYQEHLSEIEGIKLVLPPGDVRNNYQYFVIRVCQNEFGGSRDTLRDFLLSYNVHARKYFYPLCSDYQCYANLPSAQKDNLQVAQQVAEEVLCLPLYGELPVSDVIQICGLIKEFQSGAKNVTLIPSINARTQCVVRAVSDAS